MTPELSHDDTDEHTYEGAFNSDEPPYGYPFSTFCSEEASEDIKIWAITARTFVPYVYSLH